MVFIPVEYIIDVSLTRNVKHDFIIFNEFQATFLVRKDFKNVEQ
jgi:hypothetical protein